jgi:hypothetical protein
MGQIYLERNKIHCALNCYDEILVLEPDDLQSLDKRAVAKTRINDLNGAIADVVSGARIDKSKIIQALQEDPELHKVKGSDEIRELIF